MYKNIYMHIQDIQKPSSNKIFTKISFFNLFEKKFFRNQVDKASVQVKQT